MSTETRKKVFVSGCYDLLHSGHVEFFHQASQYGDLYVGIGSDSTIEGYKHHKPLYSQEERLFMVRSIRYVTEAFINEGSGLMDFVPNVLRLRPDVFVVNEDGDKPVKRAFCEENGIEYVVLRRTPSEGLEARSSTSIKESLCTIPLRVDIAGTWIDQPTVSSLYPGSAITLSIQPTFEPMPRSGLATSTRDSIRTMWPFKLPDMLPENLAKLVFCLENDPERNSGYVSGAQDPIGICVPGVSRHHYSGHFWPDEILSVTDDPVLDFLEEHLCLLGMFPRREGCSVVEGKDVTLPKVRNLSEAADECWRGLMAMDLATFVKGYRASFEAQVSMFPAMMQEGVDAFIDKCRKDGGVLAWKMTGAGGGGYLLLVCRDSLSFPEGAIPLKVRRH